MDKPKKKLRFEIKAAQGPAIEGIYVRAVWTTGAKKGSLASASKVQRRIEKLLTQAGYITTGWDK